MYNSIVVPPAATTIAEHVTCTRFDAECLMCNSLNSWSYMTAVIPILQRSKIRLITFFVAKDGEAIYSQQKQDWKLTVAQIMNSLLPNSDLN